MEHSDTASNPVIPLSKQAEWDEDFKNHGLKVAAHEAVSYELERFFPGFVLVWESGEKKNRTKYLTFYMLDRTPYFPEADGSVTAFTIEPRNSAIVEQRIREQQSTLREVDGQEGWLIPLYESDAFRTPTDVNAYLHNLMFWESLLTPESYGPFAQRFSWLSQQLYAMKGALRDCIAAASEARIRGFDFDTTRASDVVKAAARVNNNVPIGGFSSRWLEKMILFQQRMQAEAEGKEVEWKWKY